MATLGQELRTEREKHSLSLKDISDRTKVGLRYLVALEEDRWEEMPQKFFIRSIIKAHAQAMGVDPEPFLARYEEQEKARLESPGNEGESPKRKKRGAEAGGTRRILVPALAVLLVLGAAAAGYLLFLKPGEKSAPPVSSTEIPAPQTEAALPEPAAAKEPEPVPAETGLRLELRFNADSWMHISADGVVVLDGIKPAGSTASLRAEREFILQTGNAGGFDFTLNGRQGRPLGGSGVVLTDIRITRENSTTFLREENPPAGGAVR
ncbi:MAG: DUF4115 domain-containing protein [Acidobacteriota bacterium]|nr:DUF4115 domain-containing protein [Acidobacteriota bacterium]MDD8029830.1 DUF4115 domain-containing protein [Acidobacteriota bacterium]MDD8032294.1 DUF4115 domain-containing protein [Acidobacteriota bacterium]MDD8039092.1 DUF4115 domain-containing protein [Acidobacteriota bacterium]MDW3227494.1 DUF4115 domain-containing protein [Acidobacteriota bacterium]